MTVQEEKSIQFIKNDLSSLIKIAKQIAKDEENIEVEENELK